MPLTITLPKLHRAQQDVIQDPARFKVLAAGRRFGKSRMGALQCVMTALKGGKAWWISPSYPMSAIGWREISRLAAQIPGVKTNKSDRMIMFPKGGWVQVRSSDNPDSLRGEGLDFVVLDECAYMQEETWTEAIRPALADRKGKALFISTPKGLNYFYHLYSINDGDYRSWRYTTYDNPYIDRDEIESTKAQLPERVFKQEILAEFLSDGSYFQRVDEAAVIDVPDEPEQHKGHKLFGGLDWAMKEDFTVLTIGCRDCNRVVDWDRFNQIDYTYQRTRVMDKCKRWVLTGLLPERNSIGQPNIELLRDAGLPIVRGVDKELGFNTTATTKPELIQSLASAMEHDGFRVPVDYADELRAYDVMMGASGHPKFSAPTGYHDDRVMGLALCWWAMATMDITRFEITENPFY